MVLLLSLSMFAVWSQGVANALVMVGSNGHYYYLNASKQDSLL